jgi:hypothetical protein
MLSLVASAFLGAPINFDAVTANGLTAQEDANTCAACQMVTFDFSKDNPPSVATLKEADGEIRYKGVGLYKGQVLDFVITKTPNADATCTGIGGKAASKACVPEKAIWYGGVNVGMSEEHKLSGTISLRDTNTNQLVPVPMFCLTWVDLDGGETIEILGYGDQFTGYAAGADVEVEDTSHGYPYPADERNAKKFTRKGQKANVDNTHTKTPPMDMDAGQREVAFEVYFTHTASFDFIFYDLAEGQQARSVWFSGTSNFYDNCPKLVPAPPPSSTPSSAKTCMVVADPVVETFAGYHCMVQKVGAYPVLSKGNFEIQTFHCPNNVYAGAANVVAMAVSDGDGDVLEIVGEAVTLNGKAMSESLPYTQKGAFNVERKPNGQGVVVTGGKFLKLTSERRVNDKLSPGYDQKLLITVPGNLVGNLEAGCMCAATAGSSDVKPLTKDKVLFSDKSLSYVQGLCGVPTQAKLFEAAEMAMRGEESGMALASADAIQGANKMLDLPIC